MAKTAPGGGTAFVWLASIFGACVLAPPALALIATSPPAWRRGVHGRLRRDPRRYFACLQRGYRDGDLSLVYPLARGTGPLLATVAASCARRTPGRAGAGGRAGGGGGDPVAGRPGRPRRRPGHELGARHRRDDCRLHALGQARRGRPRRLADRLLLGHRRRHRARARAVRRACGGGHAPRSCPAGASTAAPPWRWRCCRDSPTSWSSTRSARAGELRRARARVERPVGAALGWACSARATAGAGSAAPRRSWWGSRRWRWGECSLCPP